MDPITIGTIAFAAISNVASWLHTSKAARQKAAADAARAQLAWVAGIVVKQIETSVRKNFGPVLTEKEARDILQLAVNRALALLAPKRKDIEKALGVDLAEVVRAELEIALADQRQVSGKKLR